MIPGIITDYKVTATSHLYVTHKLPLALSQFTTDITRDDICNYSLQQVLQNTTLLHCAT